MTFKNGTMTPLFWVMPLFFKVLWVRTVPFNDQGSGRCPAAGLPLLTLHAAHAAGRLLLFLVPRGAKEMPSDHLPQKIGCPQIPRCKFNLWVKWKSNH